MQVETDTGQTVYMQVEPETDQTAYTLRRQKTGSVMQVELETGQTAYTRLETDTGQTAYIPRWQKTGSAMQIESRDPRSHSNQTACIPTGSDVQVEPTDVPVHPGQTARLPTGNSMQLESMIQTACTPPSLATQQPEGDRRTAKKTTQWYLCEQLSTARSDQVYRAERLQWGIIRSSELKWAAPCKL